MKIRSNPSNQPAPGVYPGVCVGVYDLGLQPPWPNSKYKDKGPEVRYYLEFEIVYNESRRCFGKEYAATLGDKSTLTQHLNQWRGRAMSASDKREFDFDTLLGKSCLVVISENDRGFSSITGLLPTKDGIAPQRKLISQAWNTPYDPAIPDFIKDKLNQCLDNQAVAPDPGDKLPVPDDVPF